MSEDNNRILFPEERDSFRCIYFPDLIITIESCSYNKELGYQEIKILEKGYRYPLRRTFKGIEDFVRFYSSEETQRPYIYFIGRL